MKGVCDGCMWEGGKEDGPRSPAYNDDSFADELVFERCH